MTEFDTLPIPYINIPQLPDLGAVTDNSTVVGEHAGTGRFSAIALRAYVRDTDAANARDFGAKGDGTTDDTAALQAAIATGMPVRIPAGNYRITAQLNCTTKGQHICGDGRQVTFITATGPSAGFSVGIFNVSVGSATDVSIHVCELCVTLAQPDTSTRASLNSYPPVFYLNAAARCEFVNVRLVGGLDGIYMNGNCGGFRASGCDFGNFGRNIYIDGNLDVTSFVDCEVWPFSATGIMTSNQQQIFYDANCYGLYSLRNDYLAWTGGLFLCGNSVYCGMGTNASWPGPTYGSFNGTGFDTYGGLTVAAGNILTDSCTFSVIGGPPGRATNAIVHTGGVVTMRGSKVFVGSALAANGALVYCNVPSGDATLIVQNTHFEIGATDQRAIYVVPGSNTDLSLVISGNKFDRASTGAFTTSIMDIGAGSGAITGNVCSRNTGATGAISWLAIQSGTGPFNVVGNMGNGWVVTITGQTLAGANTLTIPPVYGASTLIYVTGSAAIGGVTFAGAGVGASYAGPIVTLKFVDGGGTVVSGTIGTASQIILNGRTTMSYAAGSSLTLQLDDSHNWREIGRCA